MSIYKLLENYKYPLESGLIYKNEFTFLVAIILSAQAKDEFVNTKTKILFEKYDSPDKILKLGNDLFLYIKSIGLWRNKGHNILKLSKELVNLRSINLESWYEQLCTNAYDEDKIKYMDSCLSNEGIPTFGAGLMSLSGVGRKSSNVFLNIIYKAPLIAVDTHVKRLSNRLGLVNSSNPLKIEQTLNEIVPNKYKSKISSYLVWHGRRVCFAKNPKCQQCSLIHDCLYYSKSI